MLPGQSEGADAARSDGDRRETNVRGERHATDAVAV